MFHDFWYQEQNKYAKEIGLLGWGDVVIWRDFRPPHVSEVIWKAYIQHVTSKHFLRQSQSGAQNQNKEIYGSITMHISGFVLFISHAKWMIRFFLLHPYFLIAILYENV